MTRGEPSAVGTERNAFLVIGVLSTIALAFLFWLIYFRPGTSDAPEWTKSLPAVNAFLNFSCACFLVAGFVAIRQGRRERHMQLMLTAVSLSALFLMSYVVYHHYQGDTAFTGQGAVRVLYFFILISHVVLSTIGLPLVLTTLFFAGTRRFDRHRRLARLTLPIWLYVSVTGVLVFLFLKVWG